MTKVVFVMSMSLDGFVTAANATAEEPMGDGGLKLVEWAFAEDERNRDFLANAIQSIGAVVAGRRTYDTSVKWWGDDGPTGPLRLPVFVVTHSPDVQAPENGVYQFLPSLTAAIEGARRAAGSKDISIMGGADIARQAINEGHVDEIAISLIPVLFGDGLRLFEGIERQVQLEPAKVVETGLATHLRYKVVKDRRLNQPTVDG